MDGGWQDQGQVLSKDLGPTTSLGLGAWLKAEALRWSGSRPSILLIGPRQGAPGPRSSHHRSGKTQPLTPGQGGPGAWPPPGRDKKILGQAGKKADSSLEVETGKNNWS